jgi:DNA-damage-inducible protein J
LRPMGVSSASVIQMMFARIAKDGMLPVELFEPNAETIAAIEAARRGEGKVFSSLEEFVR